MSDLERIQACRNTLLASAVVFVIAVASVPLGIVHYGWWPQGMGDLGHAILAAVLGLWTWRSSSQWSAHRCDRITALLTAPYLATTWWPQVVEARAGTLIEPLIANHFLLLGLAILGPRSLRWGLGLIAVFTLHAVALWAVLERTDPAHSLAREPWLTLFFAGISAAMFWSRWRRRDLEARLARVAMHVEALARLNRILLALRDRANTPLQTLEVVLAILEQRRSADDRTLATMRRAIGQLAETQQRLVQSTAELDAESSLRVDLDREIDEIQGVAALEAGPHVGPLPWPARSG